MFGSMTIKIYCGSIDEAEKLIKIIRKDYETHDVMSTQLGGNKVLLQRQKRDFVKNPTILNNFLNYIFDILKNEKLI